MFLPLKNHRACFKVEGIGQLWKYLHHDPSIYFEPMNRVVPCKFFLNHIWTLKKLEEHIVQGHFVVVEKKESKIKGLCAELKKNWEQSIKEQVIDNKSIVTAKEIKEKIHANRGDICIYCGDPTTIAARNKHKRGVICTCDWIYHEFAKLLNNK